MEYKYRKTFTFEGKRYNAYGNTLDEVYEKKAQKLAQLKAGQVIYSGNMTVKEWTDQALETYKADVKGLPEIKLRVNKHIMPYIGHKPLKSVTAIECQQILNNQSGMSFSHVTKVEQELKFIFTTAVKNRLIPFSPADDISKPNYIKGHRRAITADERKHFLKVCEDDRYILFLLMLYCGCRPGEAVNCVGNDIFGDLLHIRGTKTNNSDRWVPIPDPLKGRISPDMGDKPLSPNTHGRKHTESSYDRAVASLKREMNISMGCSVYRNALVPPFPLADDFVPYNLRHTYCTDLARAGVDIRTAQKLMGHASIEITANIYTHVEKEDIQNASVRINDYLEKSHIQSHI